MVDNASRSDLPTPRLREFCNAARHQLVAQINEILADRPVLNVAYSAHPNVGDNLISLAEDALVKNADVRSYHRLRHDQPFADAVSRRPVATWMSRGTGLLLHGGGNLGDIYPSELNNRLDAIELCPDRPVLQMPQSIYFADLQRAERFRRVTG